MSLFTGENTLHQHLTLMVTCTQLIYNMYIIYTVCQKTTSVPQVQDAGLHQPRAHLYTDAACVLLSTYILVV